MTFRHLQRQLPESHKVYPSAEDEKEEEEEAGFWLPHSAFHLWVHGGTCFALECLRERLKILQGPQNSGMEQAGR